MIIIVEGIDRVGKTTLVNKLHEMTGFPVYKNNTEFKLENMDNENETDKMIKMLQICEFSRANIIFDRFHWTDAVYGTVHRGYDFDRARENVKRIDEILSRMEAIVILVEPTDVFASSKEHGESLLVHDGLFKGLFHDCMIHDKCMCDYHSIESTAKWAFKKIVERWCNR